jgi:hypothetical protein
MMKKISHIILFMALSLPLFLLMRNIGLIDTIHGLAFVYMALNIPFTAWLMDGFFRRIPRELCVKDLPGQQATHQAHTGACIAQVQWLSRGFQTVQSNPVNRNTAILWPHDLNSHGAKRGQSGQCVLSLQETINTRGALGHGTEHDGAVGNGFIPGDSRLTRKGTTGL